MLLANHDLADLFSDHQGIQEKIFFHTVTDQANIVQPKGLFIPLNEQSGELGDAIAKGAIGAVWDRSINLPRYTPNHFPIFYTNDRTESLVKLIKRYNEILDGEIDKNMEKTNFIIFNKNLLNKSDQTYDIAVMLDRLSRKHFTENERRG